MRPDLDGRVALVTGGGAGVGEALCRRLSARGAAVMVADLDVEGARRVAADVGGDPVELDVSDRSSWDAAIASVSTAHGGIDLVALNAGIMSRPKGTPMAGDDPLEWLDARYELVRSVNGDGVAFGVLATVPHLVARGGGAIAVTASIAGLAPQAEDPAYSMTKHAVIGLVRSLGPTLAERNITIGAVCPAGVDTSMVPPDFRAAGYSFAPADHVAAALEGVLDSPPSGAGDIWVTMGVDDPPRRFEFSPLR